MKMYTREDVLTFVEEEDVKFIRLAFVDIFGKQKNIAIMPGVLPAAFWLAAVPAADDARGGILRARSL